MFALDSRDPIIIERGKNMAVVDTVKNILAKRVDVSNLKEDDDLSALGLDSLDLVEVMIDIEEELGVEFTSDEISSLNTLKDVLSLIETKTK